MVLPPLKLDLDSHLTTNVSETYLILCVGYHHMDVAVIVLIGVAVAGVVVLCGTVFVVAFDFKSIKGSIGILTPM